MLFARVTGIFLKRTSRQKKKKIGEKTGEAATVVPGTRITSRMLRTTTNKLEAGPAAKGRDNDRCVVHMCDSSVLSRRATPPAPAQRKNCRYVLT